MTYTVEADTLTQFGTNVLTALGVPTDDAHLLSDSLLLATGGRVHAVASGEVAEAG